LISQRPVIFGVLPFSSLARNGTAEVLVMVHLPEFRRS
jgi:hypothetical protein